MSAKLKSEAHLSTPSHAPPLYSIEQTILEVRGQIPQRVKMQKLSSAVELKVQP